MSGWEGLMEAPDCLRSLADRALVTARPGTPLFPSSLGVMAVANAFVMLGLLPEPEAEEILSAHRRALEQKGFGTTWGVTKGELKVRPGAHGYWQSRISGPPERGKVPSAVPSPVSVGTGAAPWPSPAECYLAALAPTTRYSIGASGEVSAVGPQETAEIVGTVADCLMAVGALPVYQRIAS